MLNYIKSECYRAIHAKGVYMAIGIMAAMVLAMNIVLALGGQYIPDFRYGSFRFSLNTLTAAIYSVVLLGAVVPGCIFMDDRRNGVLKNAVAYGISREKIFVGKCLVAFLFTFFILCAVEIVYVGSAWVLLDDPEWVPLREMLMGIGAALPSAAASLIFMMLLGILFEKEMAAAIWWAAFYYLIPMAFSLVGLKLEAFAKIASWMPYTFLRMEAIVSYSDYHCLWDTPAGLTKCIVSGVIGCAVFLGFGIWKVKKQEF